MMIELSYVPTYGVIIGNCILTCVTIHYIDSDWMLQKRILAFRVFDQAHTADNIYNT